MSKTVVGLFNSTAEAQQVKQSLVAEGYEASSIRVVANNSDDNDTDSTRSTRSTDAMDTREGSTTAGNYAGTSRTGNLASEAYDRTAETGERVAGAAEGIGEKISSFFRSLVGGDEDAHSHYASGVNQGGALLTVTAEDEEAAEVANLLRQHGAREIEGGNQTSGSRDTAYDANASRNLAGGNNLTEGNAIPVIEEQLSVGKREIDRGGVRIYSHMVERPAEADVTLRDERVNVERRAVDRPATAADFQAGRDASFELRATGEEAVVGKNSRVVEEVLIGKQATERTENVHDTVRKTEVEVEQIAGNTASNVRDNEKNRF